MKVLIISVFILYVQTDLSAVPWLYVGVAFAGVHLAPKVGTFYIRIFGFSCPLCLAYSKRLQFMHGVVTFPFSFIPRPYRQDGSLIMQRTFIHLLWSRAGHGR